MRQEEKENETLKADLKELKGRSSFDEKKKEDYNTLLAKLNGMKKAINSKDEKIKETDHEMEKFQEKCTELTGVVKEGYLIIATLNREKKEIIKSSSNVNENFDNENLKERYGMRKGLKEPNVF